MNIKEIKLQILENFIEELKNIKIDDFRFSELCGSYLTMSYIFKNNLLDIEIINKINKFMEFRDDGFFNTKDGVQYKIRFGATTPINEVVRSLSGWHKRYVEKLTFKTDYEKKEFLKYIGLEESKDDKEDK